MRRLFVTGLGGNLGSELARRGPRAGWEVAGIAGHAQLDVRDAPGVRSAVVAARPDAVVHTAYRMDDASVNVEGTRAVVAAATAADARLLHLSTDVIFRDAERPLTEEAAPDPVTAYGASKLEAERLCPPRPCSSWPARRWPGRCTSPAPMRSRGWSSPSSWPPPTAATRARCAAGSGARTGQAVAARLLAGAGAACGPAARRARGAGVEVATSRRRDQRLRCAAVKL